MEVRKFTRTELGRFDGRDGAPALIAMNGRVYDVSASYHWRKGRHQVLHDAGLDLTNELSHAPHGADLLDRFPVVGVLDEE